MLQKKWSLVLYHAGILLFPQLFCGHVDHCSNGMLQQNNSTFVLVPRTEPAAVTAQIQQWPTAAVKSQIMVKDHFDLKYDRYMSFSKDDLLT